MPGHQPAKGDEMLACAVVGDSGAGKTLLIEQVLPLLRAAGLRAGYVKHAPHGFDSDRPGSDSARVRAAGAGAVVVTGNGKTALVRHGPADAAAAAALLPASDVVLLEGFSGSDWPKIRVRASGTPPRDVAPPVLLDLERRGARWDPPALEEAAATVLGLAETAAGVTVVADPQVLTVTVRRPSHVRDAG